MPTKRNLLTIVCILAVFCQSLYSKIILRGTITDNDSDPVQGALVKLIDQDYIKLINYSDLDLNLKVNINTKDVYELVDEPVELASYFHPIVLGPVVLTLKVALNCKLAMNIDSAIDLTAGYQVKNNAVIG